MVARHQPHEAARKSTDRRHKLGQKGAALAEALLYQNRKVSYLARFGCRRRRVVA
jgi:hypothetical protein